MIIMDDYILEISDRLLYKSGNKVVDDFIRYTQIINLGIGMMEFVPYDQFKDIEFIAEGGFSKIYKATLIHGNIQGWNMKVMNFMRSGLKIVALKRLKNSSNITFIEINEVNKSTYNISCKELLLILHSFKKFSLKFFMTLI